MDINIESQLVVQTAAQWAVDIEVYSELRILITSDELYTGTDQRKFKLANGVDTWSNLDYMPLGGSSTWGGITGTLSNQTDLQAALDGKLDETNKDATGGYVGLTLFKINFKNALNTFTSFFTNSNTAARTYTFKDADGTIAFTSDITGTNSGTNTGDETAARIGAIVNGATNYVTPLDADKIGIWDVANSLFKSLTWANLKATLASTFFLDATSSIQAQLNAKYNHLNFLSLAVNPTDNQNLYLNGNAIAASTTDTSRAFTFGEVVTIRKAYIALQQSANGSNEQVDVYLRNVTTATNHLLGSFTSDWGASTGKGFVFTPTPITTSATDYYTVYIDCPTWTTNPTAWLINGSLSYR